MVYSTIKMKKKKSENGLYKKEKIKKDSRTIVKIKQEPKLLDGKIDVAKKYTLSGKILKQNEIDEIVKKRKKRNNSKTRNRRNRYRKHKRANN